MRLGVGLSWFRPAHGLCSVGACFPWGCLNKNYLPIRLKRASGPLSCSLRCLLASRCISRRHCATTLLERLVRFLSNLAELCFERERSQGLRIADEVYAAKWYKLPLKIQKWVALLIMNNQEPLCLTGYKIVASDRNAFKKVHSIDFYQYRNFIRLPTSTHFNHPKRNGITWNDRISGHKHSCLHGALLPRRRQQSLKRSL